MGKPDLYAELMRNLATRTKPEGGAREALSRSSLPAKSEAKEAGGSTEDVIRQKLEHLTELVNGYDFADVIAAYYRGFEEGNEQLKSDAVRWLRGEFTTAIDAKAALWRAHYVWTTPQSRDQLKLMAGSCGLRASVARLSALMSWSTFTKLANAQARNPTTNRSCVSRNDGLPGTAVGLGFTSEEHEFLLDTGAVSTATPHFKAVWPRTRLPAVNLSTW